MNSTMLEGTNQVASPPFSSSSEKQRYEPINLKELRNNGWILGKVGPDPRPFRHPHLILLIACLASYIGSGALVWLGLSQLMTTYEAVANALVFALIPAVIVFPKTMLLVNRKNEEALTSAGYPPTDVLFLKVPPPPHAMEALQQAEESGLFRTIGVIAPQEAFERITKIDPIIYGVTRSGRTYCICAYDIGEDLKTINS